jgi:hypothetical protein
MKGYRGHEKVRSIDTIVGHPHTTLAFCDNDVLPGGGGSAFWGKLMCRG